MHSDSGGKDDNMVSKSKFIKLECGVLMKTVQILFELAGFGLNRDICLSVASYFLHEGTSSSPRLRLEDTVLFLALLKCNNNSPSLSIIHLT